MNDDIFSLILVNFPNFMGLLVCIVNQVRMIDKQDQLIRMLIEKIEQDERLH